MGRGGRNKVGLGEVEEGKGIGCKGEGGAFGAGGDDISSLAAAIMGNGRAKDKSTIPVRVPRWTMVRVREKKDRVDDRGGEEGERRSRMEDDEDQTRQRGREQGAKGGEG